MEWTLSYSKNAHSVKWNEKKNKLNAKTNYININNKILPRDPAVQC